VGFDRPQEIMRRGFAAVVAVPTWARFMKSATGGSQPDWLTQPASVTHIRRCRISGGLANEYCELAGEVDDDYVSIGRAPDACPLHTGAPAAPTDAVQAAYKIPPPQ
jgi:membrane carboxypeptidase/penicillin-binding protein